MACPSAVVQHALRRGCFSLPDVNAGLDLGDAVDETNRIDMGDDANVADTLDPGLMVCIFA
jgi:hypothetical protein